MITFKSPKLIVLPVPNSYVVKWYKGGKTYQLFQSYDTPIALAVGNANGWLEKVYAVKTCNTKARSRSTMRGYKEFLRYIIADEKTYAIDKLPEVEVL